MEEEFLLNGKTYTSSQLNQYAKKSNLSLDEYIKESGAVRKKTTKAYTLNGKSYDEATIKEYARKSNLSIEEYIKEAGVKKKESSEPTAQERPSVSPAKPTQPSTSLATEQPTRAAASVSLGGPTDIIGVQPDITRGESKDIFTGKIKKTPSKYIQEEKRIVADQAYDYAKKNIDKQKSLSRLKDELDAYQISDGIVDGLKGVYNSLIATPLNIVNEKLGGDKNYFTSKDYKPLEREKKQALKELKEEKGFNSKISEQEIFDRAKQIFIKNDETEQLHQLIDSALPSGYDREGIWKELKLKELNSNALLKSKIASAEVFKSQLESYNEVASAIRSGKATAEEISKFEELKEKAKVAVDGLKYLEDNFDSFLKEANTDQEKLELFKYNYNDFEKTSKLLWTTTKNIFAGTTKLLADTSIYLNNNKGDYYNPVAETLSEISSEVLKESEEEAAPFYRYKASNINNFSDLGSFATQLAAEQIPVLASIYLGGVTGTALVSTSSGGQKIFELEEGAKQPFGKVYSDGEKLAAGWLYSGAEFIPERIGTARILKDLEKTISSASSMSRKMFMDSFYKNTFKGIGKVAYATGLEGGTELITAESQINIDKELLDIVKTDAENNELRAESFFSGALMGGGMAMAGGSLGFAVSQSRLYSEKKDIKNVRDILSKIDKLSYEAENNRNLTDQERKGLYENINELNNKAFQIVERNANRGVDLSIEEKSFLLDVNKKQGELRDKAKEISESNYSKEYKKEKIKELLDEFNSLEEKRNNTLSGRYSRLFSLSDKELSEIKKEATDILVSELNPIPGRNILIPTNEQIENKALDILNAKQDTTQDTQTTQPEAKPEGLTEQFAKEVTNPLADVESTANALNENLVDSIESAANILFPKSEETNNIVAEAYHKAKKDGSNPELVKAVEDILGVPTEVVTEATTPTTVTYNGTEYSKNEAGNWVNNKTGNEVKGIGVRGKALIDELNNIASAEVVTQPQPATTEQVAKTEIEEALDDIVRPKTTNIVEQVNRAKKALAKIMKGVEIILHDTEESYSAVTGDRYSGAYINGKIHLNPAQARRTTVAHEVFHAVLLKYIADGKPATVLTNKMLKAVARSLKKSNPKKMAEINEFVKNGYKGQKEIWSEEKLAEVLGYLASEYETLPQPTKNIIQKWLEKIAIMLKMKPFTDKEVVDFMNTLAERVREGQEITESDVKVVSEKGRNISSPVSLIRNQRVGAFDVEYTEEGKLNELIKNKLVSEPDNVKFMEGKNVAITSPDDMLTGSISINGSKIFEGGGGVFFVTKYGDVWASGKIGTANTLANMINDSMDKNGGDSGFLVLTKGSDSKLISSSSGVLSSLSIIDSMLDSGLISLSDFRSAVSASVKKFGGNISLRNSAKQLKDDVQKYFSNPKESTFQKRGDVLKTILEQIAQSKSVKENKNKVIEFLGGDASKGLVSKVTSENKSRNQSLSDLVAGIASEKLTKGLTVGDVYAIIEVKSKVKVKEDSHPSYPFHIVTDDGSKPVLHLPKSRESGSKVMTTSSGKPYSVGNVSVMSGSFNAPGARRQISPENSSNYANMTEDGKGNFVFYHYGPRAIKFIDPKRYGSNKGSITSKPEIAAMGRVGGMSQFYTTTEFSEANVVGDKYMIKVPMDKVYDFNTDPENLIVKAKEMFKEKHPDLPFTANDQLAYITKLAEKAGYDMTVAEWNNRTRAQSTKPLKPVDVQTMDGNTIVKPFKEDYESNVSKGFTPVIPTSKEAMLKKVYDDINTERNRQNKYDDLYHLAEEFPKKTQEEITEMIEGSNISQELKDAYATALAYEPGMRMSSRRQVNTGAITENTKAEIDRVKKLPLDAEDGATFNLDGTKYDNGGLIVPVTSLEPNTNQKELSSEMVAKFTKDNESKIGDDSIVKVGIYKFPDKDTVSVDMSIVIPNKYRAVALEFGKMIGQESLYDLDANENVKTGADGMNPVNLTDEQFRVAAAALKEGQMPQITISRRQQTSAIDRAVAAAKSRGFDDKTIMNYLVSRGYTSEEATKAVLKYNKSVAEKIRQEEGVFTRAGRRRIAVALDKFRRITVSKRAFNTKTGLQLREFMEGNINAELREVRIALEEYDKMLPKDKAQRAIIEAEADKFLKGDSTANLPLEFKAVVGRFRTHIDNLSMRLIDTGTITQAQADKLRSNIGQYVNRSYQVFDDPKWKDKVTEEMKEAVRNELRNLYYSMKGNVPKSKKDRKTYGDKFAYKVERALGKYGYDEDSVLNKMIEGEINDMINPKKASGFVGDKNIASKDFSILKMKNTEIPLSVRQLMGEYGNAGQNYAKTVQKLSALVYKADFLNKMKDLGLGVFFFEEDDPNRDRNEFNTPIASEGSKVMSPLNGLYTTPELAAIFKEGGIGDIRVLSKFFAGENGIGNAIMTAFKLWQKTLGTVKKMKTTYSLGGHVKNVLGNIELVLSNAYIDPNEYSNAFNTIRKSDKGTFKKKMDEYIRLGIISSGDVSDIRKLFNEDSFDGFLERRIKNNYLKKAGSWIDENLTGAYQTEDDFFKILGYEIEMKRYEKAYPNKSREEIQKIVSNNIKNILPNYNRIGMIGSIMRSVPILTTFMSYQLESYRTAWNNIALAKQEMSSDNEVLRGIGRKRVLGAVITQTAKHAIMHSLGTVIFSPILSMITAAGADDEEEEQGITDYDKKVKYMNLMLPDFAKGDNVVITKEGNGEVSYINFSSSDPRKGISNTISAAIQGKDPVDGFIKGAEALIEPFVSKDILLKAVTEMTSNEMSSGAKIYEEADSDYEKSLKLTNFAWKVIQPGTYTSAEKILKSDDPMNEILGQLTGYKTHKIDVKKTLYFKIKELKVNEDSAIDKYRDAVREFEEGKITKAERDKSQAQAQKFADETYNKMREYLKAASYFGAKDYEIDEEFEKNRISDYVIKTLWANEMPVID